MTTFALQRDRRQAAARRLPPAARRAARLPRRPDARRPPLRAPRRDAARAPEPPEPWLLGSSQQSAIWAAELGLPYAFADFINAGGAEIAALYRERFAEHEHAAAQDRARPSRCGSICAETDERGTAAGRQRAHDLHAAAPRRADRGAAAREGARVPCRASERDARPPASRALSAARSSARPTACALSSRTSPRNTAPTR